MKLHFEEKHGRLFVTLTENRRDSCVFTLDRRDEIKALAQVRQKGKPNRIEKTTGLG